MTAWWRRYWWWVAAALGAGFKLSLLRSQHLYAIGGAAHDDQLFMKLAAHLVRGEWLGPYDQLTLAKGAAYSLFIAVNFWLGLPLALTQQVLYVAACGIVIWALAPVLRGGWARLLAFLFLVYNPLTYEGGTMTRVLRQHLTVPLALIVAAGLIALVLRRQESWDRRWGWALLLGLALGVFWITREEGVWILPMVGMVGAALLVDAWWRGRSECLAAGGLLAITVAAYALPVGWLCMRNLQHYGWFGTVEMRAPAFKDAMGALSRVTVGPDQAYVASSRESREAIYAVSPTFAELRPFLDESYIAERWTEKTLYPVEEGKYMSGWFIWAFRDAVFAAGHGDSPVDFLRFCRRVADELNAACDDGRVPAIGRRSGFTPRWHPDYGQAMREQWWSYLRYSLMIQEFETIVPSSQGTDDDIRFFVDLSYDNLSPSLNATYFHKPDQLQLNVVKLNLLRKISNQLRGKYNGVFWLAALLLVGRVIEQVCRRRWAWPLWLALAVLGAALAELTVNFVVHTMAFDNAYPAAFAPAYPLFQLFAIIVLADVAAGWLGPATKTLRAKIGLSGKPQSAAN